MEIVIGKVVVNPLVGAVLFENLQHARVFLIAGRENSWRFTGQEECGVGTVSVDHAANHEHAAKG